MDKRKILAVLLALCLTGCSLPGVTPDATEPSSEPAPSGGTAQTEQPTGGQPETEPPQESTQTPPVILQPEPQDGDFVKVTTYIPDLVVELRYSTDNNFTGQQIYGFDQAWLRYGTVKKLMRVQEELKAQGLSLKLWDGFRPTSAQFKLWEVCPDPTYVANPNNGFSSHSRGNTVDITLVYADGTEVVMPTGFDDFSKLADRDYSDCSEEAAANALLLEEMMTRHGFKPYAGEWWHYTDTQAYPVEEAFEPVAAAVYYADCNEFISLRTQPSVAAEVITRISVGETFRVLAQHGEFALVEYAGVFGYVLRAYMQLVE